MLKLTEAHGTEVYFSPCPGMQISPHRVNKETIGSDIRVPGIPGLHGTATLYVKETPEQVVLMIKKVASTQDCNQYVYIDETGAPQVEF